MKLHYRGNDYIFWGREILPGPSGKVHNIINAFDTESVRTPKGWECQLISYSHPGGELHRFVNSDAIPFTVLLNIIFSINPYSHSDRKKDWPVYYVYAHNLAYDWSQLIKNSPMLYELTRTGQVIKPITFLLGDYYIKLSRGVFGGSSPFMSFEVERNGGGAVLEFRDTMGFYKTSLKKLAKTFKIPEKLETENIGQIDFRSIPDTDPAKIQFIDYAERDAYITRQVAEKIRELHNLYNFPKLKVSGPAFAAQAIAKEVPEDQAIITNKGNKVALQLALDAYRGGRTGGIYHGPVKGMWVFDIHSSYPAAMWSLPSFSTYTEVIRRVDTAGPINPRWAIAMLKEYPTTLVRISGIETDPLYPALVTTLPDGKLTPIYGRFEKLATTGPEVLAGIMTGGLQDVTFHEVIIYYDRKGAVSPFRNFVEKTYKLKENAEKNSPEYDASKLSLNAGYGKLIESHKGISGNLTENVTVFICDPSPEEKAAKKKTELEQAQMYFRMYLDALAAGMSPAAVINKFQRDMIQAGLYKAGKWMPINDLQLNDHEFGYYVCPPAAALITGIARTRLYLGIKTVKALYWDTDSLFVNKPPHVVRELLANVPPDAVPKGVLPVTYGPGLGEYGIDLAESSGHLAGVKRYYLTHISHDWPTNDNPQAYPPISEKIKSAIHGLPNLPKNKIPASIEALAIGEDFRYRETPSPVGVKSTTLDMAGAFLTEEELTLVESKFFLDMRLNWTGSGPWFGTVKKYVDLLGEYEEREFKKYILRLKNKSKKDFMEARKKFKNDVLELGGINDPDIIELPKWCQRKKGKLISDIIKGLKNKKYLVEDINDFMELIKVYW